MDSRMSEAFSGGAVSIRDSWQPGIDLLEGLGGRFRVQGPEDGRPVGPVELLDDVGDVRGMQLVELAHGDVQLEVPLRVAGQGLDVFPGAPASPRSGSRRASRHGVDRPQPAEAAEDAAQAEIDVGDPELAVSDEEMDIVDPLDPGPVGVDDLLVEQVLAEQDLFVARPRGRSAGFRRRA